MLQATSKNLLPKMSADGVAPKTQTSNIQPLRFRGLRRLTKVSRWSLMTFIVMYLLGYQPVIGFPPLQRISAHAQNTAEIVQEAKIEGGRFAVPFNLPHPGYVSTYFSTWHPGVDIAVGLGTPIHPISDGKVTETHYDFFGLGHYVVIEHEQGLRSTYGHMGRIFVKAGDTVTANSTIGEVGMTGRTSGPHTHLEVMQNGKYINPQTILPKLEPMPYVANNKDSSQSAKLNAGGRSENKKSEVKVDFNKELKFNL